MTIIIRVAISCRLYSVYFLTSNQIPSPSMRIHILLLFLILQDSAFLLKYFKSNTQNYKGVKFHPPKIITFNI